MKPFPKFLKRVRTIGIAFKILMFTTCITSSLQAHNGVIALAIPLENITVDGDLTDWPSGMTYYPIDNPEFQLPPQDTSDIQAYFRIGYNASEKALYIATEASDESILINREGGGIYIDLAHQEHNSPVGQYYFMDAGIYYGQGAISGAVEVIQTQKNNKRYAEWRFDLSRINQDITLEPGRIFGLDLVFHDSDQDQHNSWMTWGKGKDKFKMTDRRGDVILIDETKQVGYLQTTLLWQDTNTGVKWGQALLHATHSTGFGLVIETDENGDFLTPLPTGTYTLSGLDTNNRTPTTTITITHQDTTHTLHHINPPLGISQPAGSGKIIETGSGIRKGLWQTYSIADGLPSPRVSHIQQDKRGYLWLATDGGLCRFDGEQFTIYTTQDGLPSNHITHILEDHQSNIWLTTRESGVCRFDGKTFTTFTTRDGLGDNQAWTILEDSKNILWFGTDGGATQFDGKRFIHYDYKGDPSAPILVHDIVEDNQGNIWFATRSGLCQFNGEKFASWTTAQGLPHNDVRKLMRDSKNNLYLGTAQGAVQFHPRNAPNLSFESTAFTETKTAVKQIFEDSQGNLWFGNLADFQREKGGTGTHFFNLQGQSTFTTTDGLGSNNILSIFEDREGRLWFGTAQGGLSRYDGLYFTNFTQQQGLPSNDIRNIYQDNQNQLWFATAQGVSVYNGASFTNHTTQNGLPSNDVRDVTQDHQNNIWIGTDQGAARYDGQQWKSFTTEHGLRHNSILDTFTDQKGNIWFGLGQPYGREGWGASQFDGKTFKHFDVSTIHKDSPNAVRKIASDKDGYLWFATEFGASQYNQKAFTYILPAQIITNNALYDILQDQNNHIYMASGFGVYQYDGTSFTTFTTEQGLPDNHTQSLLEDQNGHLWFGTTSGITRYDGQVFQNLYPTDGLVHHNVRDMQEDKQGNIWIATEGGITRYRPHRTPFTINLTQIVADREYQTDHPLTLSSEQKYIAFEFSSERLVTRQNAIVYRYRLKNHDNAWQQTRLNRVEYHNISTGNYTFELEAIDLDLNYSVPIQMDLTIAIPWYRQPGSIVFLSSFTLASFLGIGFFISRYIRQRRESAQLRLQIEAHEYQTRLQLQEQNEALEKAKEEAENANQAKSVFLANMSHEIRTPMNAILGYTQILKSDLSLSQTQKKAIETIGQSGEHLLGLINDVLDISKIEAGHNELFLTDFNLKDFLKSLEQIFQIRCQQENLVWEMNENVPNIYVRGDENKLRQVLINLLGNAIKFTPQGTVALRVEKRENNQYYFEVSDSGPGISKDRQSKIFEPFHQEIEGKKHGGTGLGLAISLRHIQMMGGLIELKSAPGEGATFFFTLTLPQVETASISEAVQWANVHTLSNKHNVSALIVDDTATNIDIFKQILEKIGVKVKTAQSGKDALKCIEESMPDIIFMDIQMPEMDGPVTLQHIFDRYGKGITTIVAVSASVFNHQRQRYFTMGFDDFIDKPIRIERVYECLSEHLHVTFDFSDPQTSPKEDDWTGIVFPVELREKFKQALDTHSITNLRQHISELENLGDKEQNLANHLKTYAQAFDLDSIKKILQDL